MSNYLYIFAHTGELWDWLKTQNISRRVTRIQNHHTFIPNYSHYTKNPDALYWCKSMERSHIDRGFSQIGQNLTTFPDGKIALCRPLETMPAGIKGANIGAICIEHLGFFDSVPYNGVQPDKMTEKHKETIVRVNAMLCAKFKLEVDTETIIYHNWFHPKSCPGTNFFGGNTKAAATINFYPLIKADISCWQ